MKIAVTGAGGFVGRYLVPYLVGLGHEVIALGRDAASLSVLSGPGVQCLQTNYSREALEEQLQGVGAVVHLAGRRTLREDPPFQIEPFVEPNLVLTQRLLEAAKGCGVTKVVMASSIAAYSRENRVPYCENEPVRGLNPYGISKVTAEAQLSHWARMGCGEAISLRMAALYGFGERISAVLMRFIDQASRGESLAVGGPANTAIDQLYVRDAVGAIASAVFTSGVSGSFNIGAGQAFTLEFMARTASKAFGDLSEVVIQSQSSTDVVMPFMDIAAAKQHLDWAPQWSLSDALEDICSLYRARPEPEKM